MAVVIGVLLFLLAGITVFFSVPYSKTRTEFISIRNHALIGESKDPGVFTGEDVSHLPLPVKKYFHYCGFMGTSKMHAMKAEFRDVNFLFGSEKPAMSIDYIQYNAISEPARIAYIRSSKYGVPFEGLDSYIAGSGSMKGVAAKLFTVFNQTGKTMDQASLVTFLAESLVIPNAALQEYITWEEIDDLRAKATISCYGNTACGVFTFDKKGELLSFTTDDRIATAADGTSKKVKWSAVFGGYRESHGIKKPTVLKAIWHYKEGDLLYFDSKNAVIEYQYKGVDHNEENS